MADDDSGSFGLRPPGFVAGARGGTVTPGRGAPLPPAPSDLWEDPFQSSYPDLGAVPGARSSSLPREPGSTSGFAGHRLLGPAFSLRDGRYRGQAGQIAIELRVDVAVSRILSADFLAQAADGSLVWLASLRTRPSEPFEPASGVWAVVATDRHGATSEGRIALRAVSDTAVQGEVILASPLEGLVWGRPILLGLEWEGSALRRLGLEIEQEEAVEPPPQILFNNAPMTIQHALAQAGVETWAAGLASQLPAPPPAGPGDDQQGWSEKDLEGLMRDFAETSLDQPAFELRVLWLSRSNRRGLLGIMFDSEDALQRQGLAVFAEEIRSFVGPEDVGRKLIQTTVHEIGHALNLAHRFERAVGRADSASFMNYDWRYKGGNRAGEFWQRFAFAFDEDELAFLRHAPPSALMPGGHAFHSVRYWVEGRSGHSPHVNEAPLPGFRLELVPPEGGAPVFAFGQPVLLGLRLTNTGTRPVPVPSYLLDLKAGFVEVAIRRLDLSASHRGDVQSFTPIIARCFDIAADEGRVLQPNESISDNLNLTFGAAGFPFAEPGAYEVTAYLVIYQPWQDRELVAPSSPVRIRVGAPHSEEEERDALVLFTTAVGRYFALGGTIGGDAEEKLLDVLDRRLYGGRRRGRKAGAAALRDPVAANIVRSRAFRLGRNYHRRVDGELKLVQTADPGASLRELEKLDKDALAVFDPITAADTRVYRERLSKRT